MVYRRVYDISDGAMGVLTVFFQKEISNQIRLKYGTIWFVHGFIPPSKETSHLATVSVYHFDTLMSRGT